MVYDEDEVGVEDVDGDAGGRRGSEQTSKVVRTREDFKGYEKIGGRWRGSVSKSKRKCVSREESVGASRKFSEGAKEGTVAG